MTVPDVPPARTLRRRVIAVALGALSSLAVAECVLRATNAGVYRSRSESYHFIERPGRGYWTFDRDHPPIHAWDGDPYGRLPPGARMTYEIGDGGLRGDPPPPGRRTVLVLGDSFTFGEGVRIQDTFTSRLERSMAAEAAGPAFVNAGVPGYGTEQEAARLPALIDRYDPAAVLLVAVPNDAIPQIDQAGAADLVNGRIATASPIRLFGLVRSVFGRAASDRAVEDWYLSYYVGARSECWAEARARLLSMAALCRTRGARFGVAMFPLLYRLDDSPLAPIHHAFETACASDDVPFLDLTPALALENDRALWVHPTDHHPDARAHELAARALLPFVEALVRRRD